MAVESSALNFNQPTPPVVKPLSEIAGVSSLGAQLMGAPDGAQARALLEISTGQMRNRIINGDMRIDQRNSGAAITPATAGYTLDRWNFQTNVASKIQFGRNLNSIAPPAGFTNYLGMQCAAAYSPLAGDWFQLSQFIEGVNCYDLDFGKSTAKTITLSFWVRSSIAGQWGGSVRNASSGRSYPFLYTISTANTWEKKTITIAGDTAGTWLTDTGTGINLTFSLAMGSTYTGTAGAWASANYFSSTGSNSLVSTLNATLYITGVQLEAGNTATDFEWRDYGRELAMCQRYCTAFSTGAIYSPLGAGVAWATTTARIIVNTAAMRLSKTIATSAGTAIYLNANGNWVASTAISLIYQNESQAVIDVACAGLTVGQGVVALINTNNWLRIEAEL